MGLLEPKRIMVWNSHPSDTRYTAACWEDKQKVIIGIVIGQRKRRHTNTTEVNSNGDDGRHD